MDGVDGTNGVDGADGLGFTGGSYNSSTGIVTFTSNDGLGFSTGDLRTSYTDTDVRNVLSGSAGTGLVWNSGANQFDNSITQYTDALARTACFPLTLTNMGLGGTTSVNLFENGLWYNSLDGRNRFNFTTDGTTYIRTPLIDGNNISLQHGTEDRFYTGHTRNTSAVDLQIGDGTTNPAQLFLRGTNFQSLSSAIVFADSGTSPTANQYYNGMMIYFDSNSNKLKLTGDGNNDGIADTPAGITIDRSNNYVGILNESPSVSLDVDGAITASGTIKSTTGFTFPDNTTQTTAVSLPSYLFAPSYLKVYFRKGVNGRLSQNYEPGMQGTFFDTGSIPFNVGSYNVSQNTITIPADGVYDISYCAIIRSENSGSDRKVPITYIRINNADPNGEYQAVAGCYLREHDTNDRREGAISSSTILDLNQNDLVSIWSYREGNSGALNIQHGHIQIKRIA